MAETPGDDMGHGEEKGPGEEELQALAQALLLDQALLAPAEPTAAEVAAEKERRKRRRSGCEVCGDGVSKYSCPRCAVRTCCVACVKKHKTEASCNGKRRRTEYLPTAQMDLSTLHSDMRFVSDVSRAVTRVETPENPATLGLAALRRTAAAQAKKTEEDLEKEREEEEKKMKLREKGMGHNQPPALARLVREASARGVDLRLMPRGMTRRQENSSYFHYGRRILSWRLGVKWLCFNPGQCDRCDNGGRVLNIEKVSDAVKLLDRIQRLLKDETATLREQGGELGCLEEYVRLDTTGELWTSVCVAMKRCLVPTTQAQYFCVKQGQSLAEFLRHKAIVEYPDLVVFPRSRKSEFPEVVEESKKASASTSTSNASKKENKPQKPRLPPPQL